MEWKYGNRRVFEISLISAIALCIGAYAATNSNIGLAFGTLVVTVWTFRGVLRYFYCSNWIKVNASVLETEDLPNIQIGWRGTASDLSQHRINIGYSVGGNSYKTYIHLKHMPAKDKIHVYYNPEKPEIVCSNKGLGWEGFVFISFISLLTLYAFFPDFYIFELLSYLGNILRTIKENL